MGELESFNAVFKNAFVKAIELSCARSSEKNRKIAGLEILSGATGLGKTSALYEEGRSDQMPAILEQVRKSGYKAIFITHRWNILHEVYHGVTNAKDSEGKPFMASILYAKQANVERAILNIPLPFELAKNVKKMFNAREEIDLLTEEKCWHPMVSDDVSQLKESCEKVERYSKELQVLMKDSKNPDFAMVIENKEEALAREYSFIESFLIRNIQLLEQGLKALDTKQSSGNIEILEAKIAKFRSNDWVRKILPAIKWRDDEEDLLILTTQKSLLTFYDGEKITSLLDHQLEDYIIFMDEFDYQADVFQKLLAEDQPIQELAECLGILLIDSGSLRERLRVTLPSFSKKLGKLHDDFRKDLKKYKIRLGKNHRAFVIPKELYLKDTQCFSNQYLFRSDHLISQSPLYLVETTTGYAVYTNKEEIPHGAKIIPVEWFLRLMEKYLKRFRYLIEKTEVPAFERNIFFAKFVASFFDPRNDHKITHYTKVIPNLALINPVVPNIPELKSISDDNTIPNTQANLKGFTTWLLQQDFGETAVDAMRLRIRRAYMPITAEGVLAQIASRNLVVGLSATAYLDRALYNFNLTWVNQILSYLAEIRDPLKTHDAMGNPFLDRKEAWYSRAIPYVESREDVQKQKKMIRKLLQQKQNIRQVELQLEVTEFEFYEHLTEQMQQDLLATLPGDFFGETWERGIPFRQKTFMKLLQTLFLATENREHQGQIGFVNSLRFFKKWMFDGIAESSRQIVNEFKLHQKLMRFDGNSLKPLSMNSSEIDPVLEVNPEENGGNNKALQKGKRYLEALMKKQFGCQIELEEKPLFIWFLNAECQKQEGFQYAYQASFQLGMPVLVLTQTRSATNGINLDFIDRNLQKRDLSCVYLLEAEHFFFSSYYQDPQILDRLEENRPSNMSHIGNQVRNLWKLFKAGYISKAEFRTFLPEVMIDKKLTRLNTRYKSSDDYILNLMTNLQQQLGRLERVWERVQSVMVYLDSDIATAVESFSELPIYHNHRYELSELNQQLIEKVVEYKTQEKMGHYDKDYGIAPQPGQAVKVIDEGIIRDIQRARGLDLEQALLVKKRWDALGKAILQHDYAWKDSKFNNNQPLKSWAMVRKPQDLNGRGEIWYDRNSWRFYNEKREGAVKYDMEALYRVIQSHEGILRIFNQKGFVTSALESNLLEHDYIFHPEVVQRLLQGRLGEEAIRALFKLQDLPTSTELRAAPVFELYDFEIEDTPYRVDAKFWGNHSLLRADEEYAKWREQDGLNTGSNTISPMGILEKLQVIRACEGREIKLIVLNLFSNSNQPLMGFDENFQRVDFRKADIIFLNSCLDPDIRNLESIHFSNLVNHIKTTILKQNPRNQNLSNYPDTTHNIHSLTKTERS